MKAKDVQSGMPSPLVYLGRVYATNGSGIVSCADTKTGKLLYKERVKGRAPRRRRSRATAKCTSPERNGRMHGHQPASRDEFEVLAANELGGETLGTPAIAHGRLYIRTDKMLYAIGK